MQMADVVAVCPIGQEGRRALTARCRALRMERGSPNCSLVGPVPYGGLVRCIRYVRGARKRATHTVREDRELKESLAPHRAKWRRAWLAAWREASGGTFRYLFNRRSMVHTKMGSGRL